MIDAMLRGRLVADPERKLTKAGRDYATARLSVTDREGGEHLALLTAFDDGAVRALLSLAKGDALVVAGELSIGVWAQEGKEPRPSLRVLVHRVTPYAAQRRREASGARREGCPKIGYPRAERQPGGRAKRGGDTFLFWGDACNQPATTLTAAHRFLRCCR
jgi:single-stranded DNA-binding protein